MIRINSQPQDPHAKPATKPPEDVQGQDLQMVDLAFLGSLIPGIVHNLATPMSGVLGATQLLENRIASLVESVRSIQDLDDDRRTELLNLSDRNRASVDILARNARHLADILQVVVQRLTRSSAATKGSYCLNELLQNELHFLEANLTFKHKVKKQVSLAPNLPAAKCVYAHVVGVIDEFVTCVLGIHDSNQGPLEMEFATESADSHVCLNLTARFAPRNPVESLAGTMFEVHLTRLDADGWDVDWDNAGGNQRLRLCCPLGQAKA
ncbi:hypothetical protein KKH27_10890 [bacterium]|nr:hypothetical protein [bacterium]MBU1983584.1 hypothetical protein [bacterium]